MMRSAGSPPMLIRFDRMTATASRAASVERALLGRESPRRITGGIRGWG